MTAKAAATKLKAGDIIDDDEPYLRISKRATLRATNDINKLPTWEIGRRVYARHTKGLWQTAAITTWVVIAYNVFWK